MDPPGGVVGAVTVIAAGCTIGIGGQITKPVMHTLPKEGWNVAVDSPVGVV
jgi:hypothetical protein